MYYKVKLYKQNLISYKYQITSNISVVDSTFGEEEVVYEIIVKKKFILRNRNSNR